MKNKVYMGIILGITQGLELKHKEPFPEPKQKPLFKKKLIKTGTYKFKNCIISPLKFESIGTFIIFDQISSVPKYIFLEVS